MNINYNIKMKLLFESEKKPHFLSISSLFYDFELLHDLSLLMCVKDYYDQTFPKNFWYREGRPIKDEHRLRAIRIIKESPLIVELILHIVNVTSDALNTMIQAIEKIANWRLNREKLKLQIKKLRKEINLLNYDEERKIIEIKKKLQERDYFITLNTLIRRLEINSIKLKDIDLTLGEFNNEDDE